MTIDNPLFALFATAVALLSFWIINRNKLVFIEKGRYDNIDGLRGYLAFFVFLHHSLVWYFYIKTGSWNILNSHFYNQLGQASVVFFFMITGFLFYAKIIQKDKKIDWARLYLSRALRLFPLYLFSISLLLAIVVFLSNAQLNEPVLMLIKHVIQWVGFSIAGSPNVNGIEQTFTINAGVTWSLAYEWFFYLSLPFLSLLHNLKSNNKPPLRYLIISLLGMLFILIYQPQVISAKAFLSGMVAAHLVKYNKIQNFAQKRTSSIIIIGCLIATVIFSQTAYGKLPLILLSIAFILIVCGNTLFGILTQPLSRAFGEMAYSVYLLHGILLYLVLKVIIGTDKVKLMSVTEYWTLILLLCPLLVLISRATYQLIEYPCMHSTDKLLLWIRGKFNTHV